MARDLFQEAGIVESGTGRDLFADAGIKPPEKKPVGGLKSAAMQAVGQGIRGAGQAAADFIPGVSQDNAITRKGEEVIQANPTAVHSLEDIAAKPWTAFKEATGNALGSMGSMIAAKGVGEGVAMLPHPVAKVVGKGISYAGPVVAAGLPSYGGIRQQQIEGDPARVDDQEAKLRALGGAAAVGAIETRFGPQEWALSAFSKEGRKKLAERFAAQTLPGAVGKGVVQGAAVEGAEELVQNPIEQVAGYQDPTTEASIKDTLFGGAMGALGGGLPGGVMGGASHAMRGGDQGEGEPLPAQDILGGVPNAQPGQASPAMQGNQLPGGGAPAGVGGAGQAGAQPVPGTAPGPATGNGRADPVVPAGKPDPALEALAPRGLTDLDRVSEIDAERARVAGRLAELNDPGNGYGPMFDAERQELVSKADELATERATLARNWPPHTPGLATSFTTESGARIDGQFALMEANDLVASHDENLRRNQAFPAELQPRERDRAASEMQVSSIVHRLDPARLGESADAANGAPIVGADGLVESGNARTIALKRVYQANGQKAEAYRQYLKDNAERFGIDPALVDTIKNPVLVRVRQTPVDRAEFARQANASTVAQMSPSEQARADAARVDDLDGLNPDENGEFATGTSRDFIRRFMARLPATEQSGMIDASGALSQTGYARVRNAVLAKAYGDSPVLLRMVESLDDNTRNLTKALVRVAPRAAQVRQGIAEGRLHDADLIPDLVAAVEEISRLKESGVSIQDYLAQTSMFQDGISEETRDLMQFLTDNIRRPAKIAEFIHAYMDGLEALGNPNQGSLLGESAPPGKGDIVKAAKGKTDAQVSDRGTTVPTGGKTGPVNRGQPGDEARDQGGAQGDEGENGALTDQRQDGETDKQFAKRVVDKRMAPANLPERHGDYFLMEGATVVPVANLISTKSDAENQQGGDNGPKRVAAAASGPRLAEVEKQAARVQDLSGDKFKAKADGQTFDKRKEWGEAIIRQARALVAKFQEGKVEIGSISGFPVVFRGEVRRGPTDGAVEYRMSITLQDVPEGAVPLAYDVGESVDPVGLSMRATNALADVARAPEKMRNAINEARSRQDALAGRLDAPFQFAQTLADKRTELMNLEEAIKTTAGAQQTWTLTNTATGETVKGVAAENERAAKLKMIPWRKFSDAALDQWQAVPETPTEATPMLSRGASGPGIPIETLTAVRDKIAARMKNLPPVHVFASPDSPGVPGNLRAFIYQQGAQNDVEGALHQGEIYLFASGLRDALRAEQVLAEHEVTHYGLLGLLGKEGKRRVLQSIWARNARIRKQAHELGKRNKINYIDATEEILADMDAKELTSLSGWRGLVLALRDWFASHGFDNIARWMNAALDGTLSDQARADLFAADLVRRARAFVENGPPMSGGLASATALSQLRKLADDLPAQEKWLNAEARMRGFKDIEDLLVKDYPLFEKLAALWRKKHPADVMMSRGLQSEYEVQPDTAIDHPIDGTRLKALRRAAARVESPERGITFRVDEEGRAIVTGPARTKVPARFQRFANDNGLTLVVRRGPVDNITPGRMPDKYRETGALYFGEIGPQGIDRTGKTRFSRAGQQQTAAQRADAILADSTAKWRPLDAITKAGVKLVHFDRATKALYAKAGKLLDALTPEKVKAGVVADYGVPGAVLDQRAMMQGRKRVQLRKTEQLIDKLASLTRAESRVAYEWMNNDNTQAADYLEAQLPPESVAVLKDVREMIDKLSQEAVRLGQLDAETYKKHRYAYLRRSYAKHMEEMPGREKAKRQRAIAILGDQYKGRGMVLDVAMKSIKNVAPEWWQRKLQAGKADKGLKGEQFIRLERRAHTGEGTTPMAGIGDRSPGRLLEVAYWPAGEAIPTKLKDWERNGTWQVRDTQGDKLVLWRDFTKQERETMGEVDEARFAIARTLHGMIQDIETGRYLNWLADNHAVIDPSRVTGPVVEASERMRDAFAPEEWVKVPDTKIPGTNVMKYGKLAGRYLPGPIWNDVRQTVGFRFQPLGETYAALHSAWKTSKTALSPAVHMNNVMANFVMADWHDVGAGHILKSLRILLAASERDGKGIIGRTGNVASRAGIADREAAREILNRYQDSGGGIGTWITQEIQKEQMLPLIEALENELGLTGQNTANQIGVMAAVQKLMRLKFGEAWDAFKGSTPGGKVVQEARNLIGMYEAEDQVFRLAAWLKAKEDGINDLEAGKVARKSFLDYHINAPWVQMMRNTAFPFIAFTYRSVPMLLDVAANKPWKLMKLGMVLGALNAIGYALSGGDEDDERKLLPEEKSGSIWGIAPKLIRMPWNDAHGSPVFLDIRRFVPVGDIFDVGQPNTAVPAPPAVVPSGPLALLGELALNKSAFTGKPVTQETDTGTEKAGKVFDHLYKALAPNIAFLPGTHAWTSVTSAGGGKTDPFGREQSMAQAMASSVGFKLGSYPKDVLQYNAKRAAQAKVMEIDANINKLRREFARQGISEAEYQEKAQAQMEKKRRVMEELAEKAR